MSLWLHLGTDGQTHASSRAGSASSAKANEIAEGPESVEAIRAAVALNIERLRRATRFVDVEWWQEQLA